MEEAKKKILIYAHYYAPDVASTGQILQDLAEGLLEKFDVTVICTVPSYTGKISEEFKEKKYYKENINGVHVIRISVPEFDKTSRISRIKNLVAYYCRARYITRKVAPQDFVLAISQPPILGGMLGVYGKRILRTTSGRHPKFIYNIQDFNPEQIEAVGYIRIKLLINIAQWMDNRTCRKSDLIITVGRDLVETLKKRFKGTKIPNHMMINNWADESVLSPLESDNPNVMIFKNKYDLIDKFVFMYSGNIGLYYDFEGLIRVIEKFKNVRTKDGRIVVFAFVGDGAMLSYLMEYKKIKQLDNTIFIPHQDKNRLVYSLNAADVHWCVSAKGIKGISCPSKFYGIASVAKPILGVLEDGSEIEMLITDIDCGVVSEPGDYKTIEQNIRWFIDNAENTELAAMGMRGHDFFVSHLSKNASISKYIHAISKL